MLNIIKAAKAEGKNEGAGVAASKAKSDRQIETFRAIAADAKAGATPDAIASAYVEGFASGRKESGLPINPDTLKSRRSNIATLATVAAKTYGNRAGYDLIETMIGFTVAPNDKTPARVGGSVRDAIFRGAAWLKEQNASVSDDDVAASMGKPVAGLDKLLANVENANSAFWNGAVACDVELPQAVVTALKTIGNYAQTKPFTTRKAGKGVNWNEIG
jgi:hypothetical protein